MRDVQEEDPDASKEPENPGHDALRQEAGHRLRRLVRTVTFPFADNTFERRWAEEVRERLNHQQIYLRL